MPRWRGVPFWDLVEKTETCWLWRGYIMPSGYGQRQNRLVHRVAYEELVGPIPDGLQLDHLCRVRHCLNPAHLEPVTPAVNTRRGSRATATHCRNGHEYTPENTRRPEGSRRCRQCDRAAFKRWRSKAKVATDA